MGREDMEGLAVRAPSGHDAGGAPRAASVPRHTRPLRQRALLLPLLFLLFVAAALGVGAWQLARAQSNDREDLRERYAQRAPIATALVDSLFNLAFQQGIGTAAERYGGEVDPAGLDAEVARQESAYLAILTGDGRVVAASKSTPERVRGGAVLREKHARSALRGKAGFALSDIERDPGLGAVIESVTRFPVGGKRVRLQVGGSPLSVFERFLAGSLTPLTPVDGGDAYVLDGEGAVIAAVSESKRPRRPDAELVRLSAREREGTYEANGERFFAARPVGNTDWRIVLSAPTEQLYGPSSGTSRWLPWIILGLCALAFLSVAFLIRRTLLARARLADANTELERSQDRLRDRAVQLQRSNTELQRSNADLEQFAYVASHDLSAPLRAVAGFSQLLAARYKGRLDDDADEFIRHMQEGVDRMQRIIDDLLAYSRVDRGELSPEEVDLDRVLEEVLRGLGPVLEEHGATVTHDPLPTVRGERGQLGQVLQNLIANGIKFTDEGVSPAVHVSARRVDECWRVEVRDNGIGIEPDHAERIFKMFQRLHGPDDYPGTGIGLAICKKIVERHGGTLSVEPAPGGGSVFAFTLQDPA